MFLDFVLNDNLDKVLNILYEFKKQKFIHGQSRR